VTEPKQAEVPFTIPVVMYLRPNGRKAIGHVMVPEEFMAPEKFVVLEAKLEEMASVGIAITQEEIPGNTMSVCLDDGDFDYKTELFPVDETYGKRLTEFVMGFDVYDYRKVRGQKEEAGEL
jgi:hypothetical protein